MSRLSIPEVLKLLEDKSQEEKIQILKSNDTRTLRTILYIAFSKKIKINLNTILLQVVVGVDNIIEKNYIRIEI